MNKTNSFPKLDISQLLSCKIQCSKHSQGFIESICSFPSCENSKMLCSFCKEQSPDHAKTHSIYFKRPEDLKKTLQNENDEFHKLVSESIINAGDLLKQSLDSLLMKEAEKLDKFFEDLNSRIKAELENIRIEVFSMIMKKFFNEINEDFSDFYSQKYAQFHENILSPFIHYDKIAKNKETLTSKQFETMVSEVFNARIVAIQFNNLKDEKVKSLLQNIPRLENSLNNEDFIKKINNIFMNSFRNLYYPLSTAPSPVKNPQISINFTGRNAILKKGSTFEVRNEEEEEFGGLKLTKNNDEEISNKISVDNLAETTKSLLNKALPNEDLEVSISLPITERQDKELEILGRVFKKMAENGKKIKKLDLDCASKTQARRSVSGGISDEGIELFSKGLMNFNQSLENLRLDFSLNSAISDYGMKALLEAVANLEALKIVNLEFYMDMKITDKTLEEVEKLRKLPKIEEILINFTKTRISKENAEKATLELKKSQNLKKIEIFANI